MPKPSQPLGRIWTGRHAAEAFRDGTLRSIAEERPDKVRVAFRNASSVPLLLCWISHRGALKHFYRLPPMAVSDATCPITTEDHLERTEAGHAFCVAHVPEDELDRVRTSKRLPDASMIVGAYRPYPLADGGDDEDDEENSEPQDEEDHEEVDLESGDLFADESETEDIEEDEESDDEEEHSVQLVTFNVSKPTDDVGSDLLCCGPFGGAFLRGFRKRQRKNTFVDVTGDQNRIAPEDWQLESKMMEVDNEPYDTTGKKYETKLIGGWPVRVEDNWHGGNTELEKMLAEDLEAASKFLPEHAREYLQEKCLIWVNRSIMFGPKVCPISASNCCYHPDKRWLKKNGLSPDKAKCVEINDGPCYGDDRDLWGVGGIMVHELSHAYHHRLVKDGYCNKLIKKCYDLAMKEGLYDSVRVHGSQAPKAKAYASTNCMEYFAELSAAFLGGAEGEEEYNKWYPFNRAQIKEHDPRAYKLLARVWKVDCS